MIEQYKFPFEVDEVANKGLNKIEGVLSVREDGIHLQYEVKDNALGIVRSKPKSTVLTYKDIEKATFNKSLFSASLTIKTKDFLSALGIDDVEGNELIIDVKRKHAQDAQGTASYINSRVTDMLLNSLEKM